MRHSHKLTQALRFDWVAWPRKPACSFSHASRSRIRTKSASLSNETTVLGLRRQELVEVRR